MPYKFEYDKLIIPRDKDKRVKLTQEQREQIKQLYGKISQRKLAKMFGVSRRLIIFIGCPEKHKKNLEQRKLRGGSKIYYDTKKATKYRRIHRKNKYELYKKGELKENDKQN